MGNSHSRRAEIIKQLLPYISANSYDNVDRYWVFGASSIWDMIDDLTASNDERTGPCFEDAVAHAVADAKLHAGRVEATGRVSLNGPPKFRSAAFDGLSAEERATLRKGLELVLQQCASSAKAPGDKVTELAESLDAKFAEEMMGKLPKAVARALPLDQLNLEIVPNPDVKQYFEEAHQCYLYGFNIACAVLCRSILESALIQRFDPQRKIPKGSYGYFQTLVEIAERKGILKPDRPSAALDVRDAGNDAIHGVEAFNKKWKSRIDEILVSTRKVLLELYADQSS